MIYIVIKLCRVYIYIIEHFCPRILKYTIFINILLGKITDRDSFDDLIDILNGQYFCLLL